MEQKAVIPAGNNWVKKSIRDFNGSPVKRIADEWMLITAGNIKTSPGNWNTMTASWGGFGVLWKKDVVFTFIRPVRHTRIFADANELFTLSFFDNKYHDALDFCGKNSGRDFDKAAETSLTPIVFENSLTEGGVIGFEEASDIVICRKIYTHDIDPEKFLDSETETNYPQKDYHRMYIGEVISLLQKI